MRLPQSFDNLTWYGRGPFETYPDRKTGAKMGLYSGKVAEQYVPYIHPQDFGNKTDVRWLALTNDNHIGLAISAPQTTNFSVTTFENDGRAIYAFQLKPADAIVLNIDHAITGVGGTPVQTRPRYRTYPEAFRYRIRLLPCTATDGSLFDLVN